MGASAANVPAAYAYTAPADSTRRLRCSAAYSMNQRIGTPGDRTLLDAEPIERSGPVVTHQSPPGQTEWATGAPSPRRPGHLEPLRAADPMVDETTMLPAYQVPIVPDLPSSSLMTSPMSSAGDRRARHAAQPGPERYDWSQFLKVSPWSDYKADLKWSPQKWPLVADDLWRIAHEDRKGARRADSRVIGLGLAGALLSELILTGQVDLTTGRVCLPEQVLAALSRPAAVSARQQFGSASIVPDRIADELLTLIFDEPEPLPVEKWLEYLTPRAAGHVARRLLDARHVTKESTWRGLHREAVYRPVDDNAAAWPAARLLTPLQGAVPDAVDAVLLGLCRWTGLHRWLFAGKSAEAVAPLMEVPDQLKDPFPLLWDRLDTLASASASRLR
ncbi:GPP34 family phosphoprotein [Actinoplanes sp. NPDC051343]|uniref:GOLPH3/VPS74 family protein n=1 Tax=Actinoplanes sp. NPDC051343 TaxID=3363906 RepID=UPI0037BE1FFF